MRTSLYSILCIVIRLGAVFLALRMIWSMVNLLMSWGQVTNLMEFWASVGLVVATLLVAFLLWLFPGPLARLATGRSSHEVFESPIEARDFQWIALSVLGMYFVVSGLLGLSSYGVNRLVMSSIADFGEEQRMRVIADVFYWTAQIALGLVLALGAKGLTGVLYRLRHGQAVSAQGSELD